MGYLKECSLMVKYEASTFFFMVQVRVLLLYNGLGPGRLGASFGTRRICVRTAVVRKNKYKNVLIIGISIAFYRQNKDKKFLNQKKNYLKNNNNKC
jgi:hypothetical protein